MACCLIVYVVVMMAVMVQDVEEVVRYYGIIFAQYTRIYAVLRDCDDQVVQPQKRRLVRMLLEAVIGRMLEVKKVRFVTFVDVLYLVFDSVNS